MRSVTDFGILLMVCGGWLGVGGIAGYAIAEGKFLGNSWAHDKVAEDVNVTFSWDVQEHLNYLYRNATKKDTEYIACLSPLESNGTYYLSAIEQVSQPIIYSANGTQVTHKLCHTLMTIHSHLNGVPYPSAADIYSAIEGQEKVSCIQYGIDDVYCYDVAYRGVPVRGTEE